MSPIEAASFPLIMALTAAAAESLAFFWPWAKPSKSRRLIPLIAVILATAFKVSFDLLTVEAWTWEGFGMGVLMGVMTVIMHRVQKSGEIPADPSE